MVFDIGMGYAVVIASVIAACGAIANTVLTVLLKRFVRPPSGGTLGEVAEKAQHAAEVGAAGMDAIARKISGRSVTLGAKRNQPGAQRDSEVGS